MTPTNATAPLAFATVIFKGISHRRFSVACTCGFDTPGTLTQTEALDTAHDHDQTHA